MIIYDDISYQFDDYLYLLYTQALDMSYSTILANILLVEKGNVNKMADRFARRAR